MRKRIKQISIGKFEYVKPQITFSEESIVIEVVEGTSYSGSFTMSVTNHVKMRGIVYSTNERMECLTPQFDGEEARIRFRFHGKGLTDGESYLGEFVIVGNGCIYSLSFCANITKLYPKLETGTIKTLMDFALLAKEDWDAAYLMFYHKSFSHIFRETEKREAMLYQGIMAAKPSNHNLEEFLVAVRQKRNVHFSVQEDSVSFFDVDQPMKELLHIHKDGWGSLEIEVSSDNKFIKPEKSRITEADFLGSNFTLAYMIEARHLHAGTNHAVISLKSSNQTAEIEVLVHNRFGFVPDKKRRQVKEYKAGIVELYEAYRLKRIVTGVWANETIEILDRLHALEEEEPFYLLMKAQALIINRQRQEAEWILQEFKRNNKESSTPIWGYYLYLHTLMEREPSYVDRMTRKIELIFRQNPDSAFLFWILSFLEEHYYNNSAEKLKALKRWIMDGNASPFLYLEAYYLLTQEPYLLRVLGCFEIRILRWAIKKKALSKELADQVFRVMEMNKSFSVNVYHILEAAYEVNPKPEYIGMICSYLIKGQQYGSKYHRWFKEGIRLELRITGLYEAYLLSMDEREIDEVPTIIQMYFQYESKLPYRKLAGLYNNIIASKNENPELYLAYRKNMSRFAFDQIQQGHMDENLAVLYADMLDLGMVNEEIAHALSKILFSNKLYVFDERMVRVWVYHKQLREPQIVPIYDHVAYVQIITPDYVILFEDAMGRRYIKSVSYEMQPLMDTQTYLMKCIKLAPQELPYILAYFEQGDRQKPFELSDVTYFERIAGTHKLNGSYKAEMLTKILKYLRESNLTEEMETYLEKTEIYDLTVADRKYFLELMVENRLYEQAYELIQEYGIDQIGPSYKITLSNHMIQILEEQEDDFLVQLCFCSFVDGKYNDAVLDYLAQYYNGPTDIMLRIWKSALQFQVDTYELEDRILSQYVYSEGDLAGMDELFCKYYEKGGRELIVLAYLTLQSRKYFVDDTEIHPFLLEIMEARYWYGKEMNDTCKLALLKYLASLPERNEHRYQMADQLLGEFTCKNIVLAFFKKLDQTLVQKYHLYDKVILEYRAQPQKHVMVHYSRDEDGTDFISEDMTDVYAGIFVKQFVMFFGEMIQYYITEEEGNQMVVTQSNRLTNHDVYNQKEESRYGLINQMLISTTLQEEESLKDYMERYMQLDTMTKDLFRLL